MNNNWRIHWGKTRHPVTLKIFQSLTENLGSLQIFKMTGTSYHTWLHLASSHFTMVMHDLPICYMWAPHSYLSLNIFTQPSTSNVFFLVLILLCTQDNLYIKRLTSELMWKKNIYIQLLSKQMWSWSLQCRESTHQKDRISWGAIDGVVRLLGWSFDNFFGQCEFDSTYTKGLKTYLCSQAEIDTYYYGPVIDMHCNVGCQYLFSCMAW